MLLFQSYNLLLGDFGDLRGSLKTLVGRLLFMIATVFQIIINLNLLISLVGDVYDRVQLEKFTTEFKSKCELLLEVYELANIFRSKSSDLRYVKYMKQVRIEGESPAAEEWSGKLKNANMVVKDV